MTSYYVTGWLLPFNSVQGEIKITPKYLKDNSRHVLTTSNAIFDPNTKTLRYLYIAYVAYLAFVPTPINTG